MPEEINCVLKTMTSVSTKKFGNRVFYQGLLFNKLAVMAFSNWGKVAAATTATQLITEYHPKKIIFTGVAGALQTHLNIGDVIVGTHLYQHDMDARPLFKQFEIPIINKTAFKTNLILSDDLFLAVTHFLSDNSIDKKQLQDFNITNPKVYKGGIASGDQFISSVTKTNQLNNDLPDALCVEMEGAAVAQVCCDYQIDFGIIRTISDKSQHKAAIDFKNFAHFIASQYALGILKNYLS